MDDAIAVNAGTIWAQLGIVDQAAKAKALAAGLNFTMNRCIMVEMGRLFGS